MRAEGEGLRAGEAESREGASANRDEGFLRLWGYKLQVLAETGGALQSLQKFPKERISLNSGQGKTSMKTVEETAKEKNICEIK